MRQMMTLILMNQTCTCNAFVHMFRPRPLAGRMRAEDGAYGMLDGVVFSTNVVDDAGDAQGSCKTKQVGHEAESDAEEQGSPESLLHGSPDPLRPTRGRGALFLCGGEKTETVTISFL